MQSNFIHRDSKLCVLFLILKKTTHNMKIVITFPLSTRYCFDELFHWSYFTVRQTTMTMSYFLDSLVSASNKWSFFEKKNKYNMLVVGVMSWEDFNQFFFVHGGWWMVSSFCDLRAWSPSEMNNTIIIKNLVHILQR